MTHRPSFFRFRPAARIAPVLLCALAVLLAFAVSASAVTIDIYGPGQSKLRMAMADPMGPVPAAPEGAVDPAAPAAPAIPAPPLAATLQERVRHNLVFMPFIASVDSAHILGGTKLAAYSGQGIDFHRFQIAEADLLLTTAWIPADGVSGYNVEMRLYEVYTGRLVVGKAYYDVGDEQVPVVADKFCAAIMKALTGRDEFFLSTLAFIKRDKDGNKNVHIIKPTGRGLKQVSFLKGFAISPSWSNDGRYVIFTHIGDRYHSMGVWDRTTGEVHTIKYSGNTIIGPTFTPENKVAVSLASGGSPNIYQLNHVFKKEKVLVDSWAIDVSPSFNKDGSKMAFVSSRLGNPHIFIKDFATGEEKRVTFEGKYNTHPSLSPDGTLVAFARRTDAGHRIFVMDLKSGIERQVTFGPGNDEQPAFGTDGYYLAFSSNRSGKYRLYLTTRHGTDPIELPTGEGEATFPDWGMIPEE